MRCQGFLMHYKIKGLVIRSENAAKSISQASSYLIQWIESREPNSDALDFGCGKLRYSGSVAKICQSLTLVDSEIQLNRIQKLGDEYASVQDFSKRHWPHSRTLTFDAFLRDNKRYDFALCANVLPTIPSPKVRATILRGICDHLRSSGNCLFVTQYTNSYFTKIRKSANAIKHLDGWIIKSKLGNAYYGILTKRKLEKLVSKYNFHVSQSWTHGQSAYVLARKILI